MRVFAVLRWLILFVVFLPWIDVECNGQFRFSLPPQERNVEEEDEPETIAPIVEFSTVDFDDDENAGTSTVVTLTRTGDMTSSSEVLVSITGGTAVAPGDYDATGFPATVTFAISDPSETISIPITNDSDVEPAETITFSVVSVDNATIGAKSATTFTINDNDLPPDVMFSQAGAYQDGEAAGTTNVVTLTRSGDLTNSSQVLVTITGGTADDPDDYDAGSYPLTVTFASLSTSETVPIPIVDDSDTESTETITFSITAVDNANVIAPTTATLEIVDNDDLIPPTSDLAGTNLIPDPTIVSGAAWSLGTYASFDSTRTHTADGTGSIKITQPNTGGGMVSAIFLWDGAGYYTYSYYVYQDAVPAWCGSQIKAYDGGMELGNIAGLSWGGARVAGEWREITNRFYLDGVDGTDRMSFKLFYNNTINNGSIWFDDIRVSKEADFNPRYREDASAKTPFNGGRITIDTLGNLQRYNGSSWVNYFPIMLYTDGGRADWSIYSDMGFNTNAWATTNNRVQKAVNAGMFSFFNISDYIKDVHYGDTALLTTRYNEIVAEGNEDWVLGAQWDNEGQWDEDTMPITVTDTFRALDADVPIYILQGNEMASPYYSALQDLTGTYAKLDVDSATSIGWMEWVDLNLQHHHTTPSSIAQINQLNDHPGDMRASWYINLMNGARGIAYFSDGLSGDLPFEEVPWRYDSMPLATEAQTHLIDLIRSQEWVTGWNATSSTDNVKVKPRSIGSDNYFWVMNHLTAQTDVTVSFTGTYGSNGDSVYDLIKGYKIGEIAGDAITIKMDLIGSGRGTGVYQIGVPDTVMYNHQDLFTTTEAGPMTTPRTSESTGTMQLVQISDNLSISGAKLVVPEPGVPSWGSIGAVSENGVVRDYGQVIYGQINWSVMDSSLFGFSNTLGVAGEGTAAFSFDNNRIKYRYTGVTMHLNQTQLSAATDYEVMIAFSEQSAKRAAVMVRGGAFTDWHLYGVLPTGNETTVYPVIANLDGAFTVDSMITPQVADVSYFPRPIFDTAFGGADGSTLDITDTGYMQAPGGGGWTIAETVGAWEQTSQRLHSVGAVESIATTDVDESDIYYEALVNAPSGGVHGLIFRYSDSNNYWEFGIDITTGDYTLTKYVAGTPTVMGTVTASVAADTDTELRIHCLGSEIIAWGGASQLEITDAHNQTETIIGFKADGVDAVQFDNAAAWTTTQVDVPALAP